MDQRELIEALEKGQGISPLNVLENYADEVYIDVREADFRRACLFLHQRLNSPVMIFFAADEAPREPVFTLRCGFIGIDYKKWFFISTRITRETARFTALAKEMHSATFFEREMREMFGIEPLGNPDIRRLNLHDEVWPDGCFPLRKDFDVTKSAGRDKNRYGFKRVEGEGIFEIPVGPVHAGIIGPGHFRFSVAGEPIINLETRLGFTHRGVEKIFEGKNINDAVPIAECVAGDAAFSHGMAFCQAAEKICRVVVPQQAMYLRGIFLELERLYNHIADVGGMAMDVGFSFSAAYAAIMKENILSLNEKLTNSRYLKGVNMVGGVSKNISPDARVILEESLAAITRDFAELKNMLFSSVSFMDRVDNTGVLRKKTAADLGVIGVAGRACGLAMDLRKHFPGVYEQADFNLIKQENGDVLARLNVRLLEFEESVRLIRVFLAKLTDGEIRVSAARPGHGFALGYVESWRGPVLYWLATDKDGRLERCKIVDASFHNWPGLCYAVLGNIVPDFPLCNKSFNLSYSGNDL